MPGFDTCGDRNAINRIVIAASSMLLGKNPFQPNAPGPMSHTTESEGVEVGGPEGDKGMPHL